ncbi:hypothetical protein, partial [Acinetobacter sp. c3-l95]|uniref:hypothetical protein n=1 Tax=Acinetobacter sp. c3-l95 TaxID=3342804 RepID=UPI0035B76BD9
WLSLKPLIVSYLILSLYQNFRKRSNEQQFHQMTKAFHHELSNDKLDAYFQQRLPNIFSIIFNDLKQISDGL